jgi:hypothetical protein
MLYLEHCIIWLKLDAKKIGAEVFRELRNVMLDENEEDNMVRQVTNEEVPGHTREKRTLLNNILRRKANLIGHILRTKSLLHYSTKEEMTKVKGVEKKNTAPC